jgi:hypothetical protein
MGMNCQLKGKRSQLDQMIEIEKLYNSIKTKSTAGEVAIANDEELRTDLKQVGLRNVIDHNKDILTKEQYQKLKTFRSNNEIVIRKADKSNTFVIMNRLEYCNKINEILEDGS